MVDRVTPEVLNYGSVSQCVVKGLEFLSGCAIIPFYKALLCGVNYDMQSSLCVCVCVCVCAHILFQQKVFSSYLVNG